MKLLYGLTRKQMQEVYLEVHKDNLRISWEDAFETAMERFNFEQQVEIRAKFDRESFFSNQIHEELYWEEEQEHRPSWYDTEGAEQIVEAIEEELEIHPLD